MHLAYLCSQPVANLTPTFLENYVFYAIDKDAQLARANPAAFGVLIMDEILPQLSDSFIAKMAEFAEAIAKDSKGISDLCHYDLTDVAETPMPEVFEVFSLIRETVRVLYQNSRADGSR